jgi:hypothetical protein
MCGFKDIEGAPVMVLTLTSRTALNRISLFVLMAVSMLGWGQTPEPEILVPDPDIVTSSSSFGNSDGDAKAVVFIE